MTDINIQTNKSNIPSNNVAQAQQNKALGHSATAMKPDTFVSTTKKQNPQNSIAKILAVIGVSTLALVGGAKVITSHIAKKANKLKFVDLSKMDLQEELYQFIKVNDPDCKLFHNKEKVLELNKLCNDDTMSSIKKLSLFRSEYDLTSHFNLNEIVDMARVLNKDNVKHLDYMLTKTKHNMPVFKSDDITEVLPKVNEHNKSLFNKIIDVSTDNGFVPDKNSLKSVLGEINEKSKSTYEMILDSRKNGSNTSLELKDVKKLADRTNENTIQSMNYFLGLESKDGLGYALSSRDLVKHSEHFDDSVIDAYKKVCTKDCVFMDEIITSLNKDNANTFVKISEAYKDVPKKPYYDTYKYINDTNSELVNKIYDTYSLPKEVKELETFNYHVNSIVKKTAKNQTLADNLSKEIDTGKNLEKVFQTFWSELL